MVPLSNFNEIENSYMIVSIDYHSHSDVAISATDNSSTAAGHLDSKFDIAEGDAIKNQPVCRI
jgi:hypothetical protein